MCYSTFNLPLSEPVFCCFNPCFYGMCYSTIFIISSLSKEFLVSILVFMECVIQRETAIKAKSKEYDVSILVFMECVIQLVDFSLLHLIVDVSILVFMECVIQQKYLIMEIL